MHSNSSPKKDDSERLGAIATYCKTQIKNIYHPLFGISTADLTTKAATKPSQTIERGWDGRRHQPAFRRSRGLRRPDADGGARSILSILRSRARIFMQRDSVAECGRGVEVLRSRQSLHRGWDARLAGGGRALIGDPDEPKFVQTRFLPGSRTRKKRSGRFELLEDGN